MFQAFLLVFLYLLTQKSVLVAGIELRIAFKRWFYVLASAPAIYFTHKNAYRSIILAIFRFPKMLTPPTMKFLLKFATKSNTRTPCKIEDESTGFFDRSQMRTLSVV